mmetsp:Transcript_9224/g.19157  ORF Transcript_9224/g.19157 Transcript_9224/m.19157 type:complete len:243 (-) Transcript_9224:511-1239(-)
MDSTVVLKDKNTSFFHEKTCLLAEEKIGLQDTFAFFQFCLGRLKVEFHAEAVHEFHNRIRVIAILHDIGEVLHQTPSFRIGSGGSLFRDSAFAQQDSSREVTKQVRGVGCNRLLVSVGVEKLDERFQTALGGIIPVHKERPMQQPRSFRKSLYRTHSLRRNKHFESCLDGIQCNTGGFPLFDENLASQSPPQYLQHLRIDRFQIVNGRISSIFLLFVLLFIIAFVTVIIVVIRILLWCGWFC